MPNSQSPTPRILIANDDGINSDGIRILETIARTLTDDVWMVAPEHEQSGAAHSLTLHQPLRMRKVGPKRYAVSGTPTDCVLLALKEIIPHTEEEPHKPVTLVLSGINQGSNVGDDITYSGTVAAAMEGTVLNVPSIALSQLPAKDGSLNWSIAEHYGAELISKLLKAGWPANTLININFPDCTLEQVKGVRVCVQGKRLVSIALDGRIDPKGRPYFWLGGAREDKSDNPDSDISLLEGHYITVTPLKMDLTDYKAMQNLTNCLE